MLLATALTLAPSLASSQPPAQTPTIRSVQIGFGGIYKLGCWTPIVVELTGGTQAYTGQVAVTVPDTDGVPTTIFSPDDRPVGVDPGQSTSVRLFVRIGQARSTIHVRFLAEGRTLAERKFYSGSGQSTGVIPGGVAATNRLLLEFGPTSGVRELIHATERDNDLLATKIVAIKEAAELPINWIGYEAIDTVLLNTSQPELYRPLLQNPGRIASLRRWVELGGRLVVFCGAQSEELLAEGGPLAELIPGTFAETVPLRQWQPLETFSGAERPKSAGNRLDLRVPKLLDVQGKILAHAGSLATTLPLVVRSRLGLGELVFVGLDFDQSPLRDWKGRTSFLRKVFNWNADEETRQQADQGLASVGSDDMIGKIRIALDNKFVGVEVVPFALVAFFVVIYILLIGPGDYFLVKKFLKRPELTWITFPLIVLGVSAAAYWYANSKKGDQLRVNQVEIVDVDTTSGLVRGTVWSHFFTPRVDQYRLTLKPDFLGGAPISDLSTQTAWLGLPGYSLGGMQSSATQTAVFSRGYTYSSDRTSMQNVPVQVWSTKTITARWSANVGESITADLQRTSDELLAGKISNSTGIELDDCLLLYGRWAYHLGRMTDKTTVNFDYSLQPRTVKTSLTSATAGDTTEDNTADDGTVPFRLAESDITRLVKTMMFFKAINGRRYSGKLSRYQSFVDLSHLLQQEDVAILLAKSSATGSQWHNADQPLRSDDDRRWTFYRFVLPVSAVGHDERPTNTSAPNNNPNNNAIHAKVGGPMPGRSSWPTALTL